jgi:hypothetical protein
MKPPVAPPPPLPRPPIPILLLPPPAPPPRVVEAAPEACPSEAEIKRLRAARPRPLRVQRMPATPAERVARTAAQLGLYEASGAWADKVEEALARCPAGR